MKLSTKTRYAVRAMLELAHYFPRGGLLLKDIAKHQEVSVKYLDHIFSVLQTRGLIKSSGKGKGYALGRPPREISVYDIVTEFEDSCLLACVDNATVCRRSQTCGTRPLWKRLSAAVQNQLRSATLEELAKDHRKIIAMGKKNHMYYI